MHNKLKVCVDTEKFLYKVHVIMKVDSIAKRSKIWCDL